MLKPTPNFDLREALSAQLKASVGASTLRIRMYNVKDRAAAEKKIQKSLKITVHPGPDPFTLIANTTKETQIPALYRLLSDNRLKPAEFAVGQPSMDEVFFALTGHSAEEKAGEGGEA